MRILTPALLTLALIGCSRSAGDTADTAPNIPGVVDADGDGIPDIIDPAPWDYSNWSPVNGLQWMGDALADGDGDGYVDAACGGGDCDDTSAERGPAVSETCDGTDNDCDGAVVGFAVARWR